MNECTENQAADCLHVSDSLRKTKQKNYVNIELVIKSNTIQNIFVPIK